MLNTGKRILFWLGVGFLLCGVMHVLLYKVLFADGFAQFYCGAVTLGWGLSVRRRVTDERLRRLMTAISALLLCYLGLQTCSYSLFGYDPTIDRYLGYAFYCPMIGLSVAFALIALSVRRAPEAPLPRLSVLLTAAGAALALGVLTNDVHGAYKSPSNGWLFYTVNAFIYATYACAFIGMLRKNLRLSASRWRWFPVLPLLFGLMYLAFYPMRLGIRLFGCRVWNIGEVLVFGLVTALEACIQVGLIPANTDYGRLFAASGLDAAIVDERGLIVYLSGPAAWPFEEGPRTHVVSQAIAGGAVVRAVDVTRLHRLNEELEDAAVRLKARNDYLAEAARVEGERAEARTRNDIYDRITRVVRPQLDRIGALLDDRARPFDQRIRPITAMSAYIKRRSNMELLARDGCLPLEELKLALWEMTETLRLCGVSAAVTVMGEGTMPAAVVTEALTRIEGVIEEHFDLLQALMVFVRKQDEALAVRLMLTAREALRAADGGLCDLSEDGREMTVGFVSGGMGVRPREP